MDSCRRFLKKRRIDNNLINEILSLFSKLSQDYSTEYQAIFKNSYTKFLHADSRELQDFIDIKGWLEVKVES